MPDATGIISASYLVQTSNRAFGRSDTYLDVGWCDVYTNYTLSSNILPVILQSLCVSLTRAYQEISSEPSAGPRFFGAKRESGNSSPERTKARYRQL